ncbi:MAG TPA: hypothetical protein VIL07_02500 [Symbiobacteriaceae bacterium]
MTFLLDPLLSMHEHDPIPSAGLLSKEEQELFLKIRRLDRPVLVVFWQRNHEGSQAVLKWARGCKALAGDTFVLVDLELDRYPALARWCQVTEVPAVLVLIHGEVVDRLEGDYHRFSHWITGASP